jgi:hypothetical protein
MIVDASLALTGVVHKALFLGNTDEVGHTARKGSKLTGNPNQVEGFDLAGSAVARGCCPPSPRAASAGVHVPGRSSNWLPALTLICARWSNQSKAQIFIGYGTLKMR